MQDAVHSSVLCVLCTMHDCLPRQQCIMRLHVTIVWQVPLCPYNMCVTNHEVTTKSIGTNRCCQTVGSGYRTLWTVSLPLGHPRGAREQISTHGNNQNSVCLHTLSNQGGTDCGYVTIRINAHFVLKHISHVGKCTCSQIAEEGVIVMVALISML